MQKYKLAEIIFTRCKGKCYRCKECIGELLDGVEDESEYMCAFDDDKGESIIPNFHQIMHTMQKMANDGNEFYQNAIEEYIHADHERKSEMKNWLVDQIKEVDFDLMNLETALFLMQFPED